MRHDFKNTGTLQWGIMGLSSEAACSYYKCKRCGQAFEHRYNVMPSIYEAMKAVGIDFENCLEKVLDKRN